MATAPSSSTGRCGGLVHAGENFPHMINGRKRPVWSPAPSGV